MYLYATTSIVSVLADRPRLLVVTSRFPYPLEKGDKLRLYHQLRELSKTFDLYLFAISDSTIAESHRMKVEELLVESKVAVVPSGRRWWRLLRNVFSALPWQVAYYTDERAKSQLWSWLSRVKPHVVYLQLARTGEYLHPSMPDPVVDYMDAFSIGMSRRAHVVPWYVRWFYKIEARRMYSYERQIFEKCKGHTIISQQDASEMQLDQLTIVSNGIDTDYFTPCRDTSPSYQIGFVGNMGYLPNVAAAEYLCSLINGTRRYTVLLAGARPSSRVKQLASDHVTVSGWVDDIRTAYTDVEVFVAPLYNGTGQQNKILEAMAMGVPVVTTEAVNKAIGAAPGKEVLVASNPTEFCEAIDKLLVDKVYRDRIVNAARTFVEKHFSWQSQTEPLTELLLNNIA